MSRITSLSAVSCRRIQWPPVPTRLSAPCSLIPESQSPVSDADVCVSFRTIRLTGCRLLHPDNGQLVQRTVCLLHQFAVVRSNIRPVRRVPVRTKSRALPVQTEVQMQVSDREARIQSESREAAEQKFQVAVL